MTYIVLPRNYLLFTRNLSLNLPFFQHTHNYGYSTQHHIIIIVNTLKKGNERQSELLRDPVNLPRAIRAGRKILHLVPLRRLDIRQSRRSRQSARRDDAQEDGRRVEDDRRRRAGGLCRRRGQRRSRPGGTEPLHRRRPHQEQAGNEFLLVVRGGGGAAAAATAARGGDAPTAVSSNAYASSSATNSYNVLTDRSTSRVVSSCVFISQFPSSHNRVDLIADGGFVSFPPPLLRRM